MINDSFAVVRIRTIPRGYIFHGRELNILHLLAKDGPLNIYQIAKRLNIEYSVAHTTVKRLEDNGFVRLIGRGQGEKGVPTMIYGLTLKGIISSRLFLDTCAKMDEICEKWKHLAPLFLGRWNYFKELGLEEDIIRFLVDEIEFWVTFRGAYTEKGEIQPDRLDELIFMNRLASWIYREELRRNRDKWIKAFQGDKELRTWIIKELNTRYEKHKYWMQRVLEDLAFLKALEDKAKEGEQNV